MSAAAFTVARGETVRIVDVDGGQAGDFVAFRADAPSEKFSQVRTRVENGKIKVTAGDRLWTNTNPPRIMFEIVEDTCGAHDLLYAPCCRYALDERFGVDRDGCWENLAAALAPWKIGPLDIPDPLNVFFNVIVDASGRIAIGRPISRPGDLIALRAAMDCIAAVSACAAPRTDAPNGALRVEIVG